MREQRGSLTFDWSPMYRSAWDETPEKYVEAHAVAWGRSRRLARIDDASRAFKAYLGVQHYDASRWYGSGEAQTRYFLSFFVGGRTVTLRTFPSVASALVALGEFYASLTASSVLP